MVKSDYVKGHISRLLSYTLKMGNGGAAIQRQQSDPSDSNSMKPPPVVVPDRSKSEGDKEDFHRSSEVSDEYFSLFCTCYEGLSYKSIAHVLLIGNGAGDRA